MTEEESHGLVLGDHIKWMNDREDVGTVIGQTNHTIRVKWDHDGITLMHRTDLEHVTLVEEKGYG